MSRSAITHSFLELTSKDALARMLENDVPCGEIVEPENIHIDRQIVHNAVLETRRHPSARKIRQPRPAARFSATSASIGRLAAVVGENNVEVLEQLGRSPADVEALREAGVIG